MSGALEYVPVKRSEKSVKALRQLADRLEGMEYEEAADGVSLPDAGAVMECVNMGVFASSCGTIGCIAGHAVVEFGLFTPEEVAGMSVNRTQEIMMRARQALDLDFVEGHELFLPSVGAGWDGDDLARVLRCMADGMPVGHAWMEVEDEKTQDYWAQAEAAKDIAEEAKFDAWRERDMF